MAATLPVIADSFTLYLAEVRRFPRLSPEEEQALALRVYDHNDVEAAHRLITANLRFVVKIASEYRSYGLKMLDLIQEGNIGLMMAVRKFNPHKGFRLISYAVWWIRAYIQNYIVSAWSLLKIGTTQAQRKLFFKLNQAKAAIRNMTGDDDLKATALALDVKESEVEEMDLRMRGEFSLDAAPEMDGQSFLDTLADDRANQEELLAEQQENDLLRQQLALAMTGLTERERQVLERRIVAEDPSTLQEIADELAISRERVRQIEENALRKMKKALTPLIAH
jgi:RNA polymerase sigma-32 factor